MQTLPGKHKVPFEVHGGMLPGQFCLFLSFIGVSMRQSTFQQIPVKAHAPRAVNPQSAPSGGNTLSDAIAEQARKQAWRLVVPELRATSAKDLCRSAVPIWHIGLNEKFRTVVV